ncbi:MAG: signal peptide peptidase SppA [Desulfofustis sp.]|nr:signal peptide peptidase SppA [Desulfofustis sp.]
MTFLFRLISNFFKAIFLSLAFLRSLIFNLLFIALVVAVIYFLRPAEEVFLEDDTILKLNITGDVVEQPSQGDPFGGYGGRLLGLPGEPRETVLQDILDGIAQAENDPKISAILLDLKNMGRIGLNQMESIGQALLDFKRSNKPVVSAGDYFSQNQYYLASHADSLFLNPMGGIDLHGFGLYRFYFKEALEKLKVDFHVFQVGSYKSALEPITRNSMSAEDRSQTRAWLSALWENYTVDVAEQRSLKPEDINNYINSIPSNLEKVGGDTAKLALSYGLVDELKTRQEVRAYLSQFAGYSNGNDLNLVSLNNYLSRGTPSLGVTEENEDQVGLIVAQGTIVTGESRPGTIGADTISALLRRAGENDRIKAVVLRIDSGGGSAFASELIRQEILALKEKGKPLFVSMGTFAASGGYWIAADADEIWASPNTLTGSIGIFMALPTFDTILKQGGIHRDGVGTTNLAAGIDLSKPLSEELRRAIELSLQNGYDRFISLVAEGRDMEPSDVEALAQGKVYAGEKAREIGLVDELGALDQVIEAAAVRSGISDYSVNTLVPSLSWWDRLLFQIGAETRLRLQKSSVYRSLIKSAEPALSALQTFLIFPDPNGMYAHWMINYFE